MESRTVANAAVPVANDIVNDQQRPEWMSVDGVSQPAMGFRFNNNSFANNSFFGSADNSKVTVDELLLLPLLDKGLDVRDRHEVLDLCKTADGFRLTVMDHQHKRIRTMQAEQVILAAGTLNTLKLLFASRTRGSLCGMPALGHGIGGNGDVPAYWPCQEKDRDFTTGTPCHGRFTVDTNTINLTRYGLNGIEQIPMPTKLRQRLKRDLILVGMGADKADGKAHWYKGRLRLRYPQNNSPVLKNIYSTFEKIGTISGRKVWFMPSRPLTVHPFGGARLGQSLDTGVINQYGEVHDIPGLFIADASALPAAPDVPPSMTIAAWAGHVADQFTQQKN
jgi:cholesterol oxidase